MTAIDHPPTGRTGTRITRYRPALAGLAHAARNVHQHRTGRVAVLVPVVTFE